MTPPPPPRPLVSASRVIPFTLGALVSLALAERIFDLDVTAVFIAAALVLLVSSVLTTPRGRPGPGRRDRR